MPEPWYDRLHVNRVINARGTLTSLGGSRMFPSAAQAMVEASTCFVELAELGRQAGEHIARRLEVEAALITAGAAAGLTQAAAASMAGTDPFLRSKLPEPLPKNEIIIQCTHRNPFERALLLAGAKLLEIGNAIETRPFELEGAINDHTAAVVFFLQSEMLEASLGLEQTLEITHRFNLPVIVDAAAELPPKSNLWTIAQAGADLVIFSGGKDLRGPQSSGLMVGKKDLIEASALQAAPYEYAVARPMKASKETILGLVAAVEAYMEEDESERFKQWNLYCDQLEAGLGKIPGLVTKRLVPNQPKIQPAVIPRLAIQIDPSAGFTLERLNRLLQNGDPKILAIQKETSLVINTHTLTAEEVQIILSTIEAGVRQMRR
jgi:L-seryl-tRNA(Ser) seleniumtransferase